MRRRTFIAVAFLTLAGAAFSTTVPPPAEARTHKHRPLPLCSYEDSAGPCRWDAAREGNGVGVSFRSYPTGPVKNGAQSCVTIYPDGSKVYNDSCSPGV